VEEQPVNGNTPLLPGKVLTGIAENLFAQLPYILYVFSVPSYRFIYANQALINLMRDPAFTRPADIDGKHPWEVFPRWREQMMPLYEDVRTNETARHLRDVQFPLLWGISYRDMSLIPNADAETGIVTSISTLTVDMTERKQAEEALRTSEEKYRSIAESAAEAIVAADSQGNIISWNTGAEAMFGYTHEEIIGKPEAILMPERYRAVHLEGVERMRRTGRGHLIGDTVVFAGVRKDSSEFPLEISLSTWVTTEGRFYGAIIRDITEHTRIEEELTTALNRAEHAAAREKDALQIAQDQLTVLQRALLPREPVIAGGYTAATAYLPAYEGQEIGGDFYDVFSITEGKAGLIIGDVSGKGINAAALAAATRSTIRALAHEFLSASQTLMHANAVLYPMQPSRESFVTAFLAILDLESGMLQCSSAGHVPPAIYHHAGEIEFLQSSHLPLGMLETTDYEDVDACLAPGDEIILYTDGLSEARRDSEQFGTEGIARALAKIGDRSPFEVVDLLLAAAGNWAHGHFTDDVGLVIVQRGA